MKITVGRVLIEAVFRARSRGRCDQCAWWVFHQQIAPGDRGFCRRKAPNADAVGRASWPSTLGHHGCGDFIRQAVKPQPERPAPQSVGGAA